MTVGKELALLFAVLFLPGMLAQTGQIDPGSFESISYHIQILAVAIPQILLVVAVGDLRRPGSSRRYGFRPPDRSDLIAAIIGLVATWVTVGIISLAAGFVATDADAMQPAVSWTFGRYELVPLAAVSALAIGYREEIFFRAFIADRAEEAGVDPRVALGVAALVFAAGHVYQGLAGFVISLAIGMVLAGVYLRTRSLHGVAIAHGLYNLLVLLAAGAA